MPGLDVFDMEKPDLENALQGRSIADIREQLINAVNKVFKYLQDYASIIKKGFYIWSIFMLVKTALKYYPVLHPDFVRNVISFFFIFIRYMVNYHADDSFDNMLIDDNLRKLWQNDVTGNFRNLEPIKNWEKAERYQVATNLKMTFKEKRKILPKLTSTLIFTAFTISIYTADFTLTNFLNIVNDTAKYGISFKGMDSGFKLGDLLGKDGLCQYK